MKKNNELFNIVNSVFLNLRNKNYMIIKYSRFDNLSCGCDVDVLCEKKIDIAHAIISTLKLLIKEDDKIEIHENSHLNVDVIRNCKIYIRFDLIDNFNVFHKITVNEVFAKESLERKVSSMHLFRGEEYPVFHGSEEDDLIIRFLDFVENYKDRPLKIKHFDFIVERILENPKRSFFLKKLGEIIVMPALIIRHDYLFPPKYSLRRFFALQFERVIAVFRKMGNKN
ncbi:MAG: hypothetical protein KAT05_07055 [Spirochaetes bacterium]|nr:hypothetical protein [Spirochaetota bacterium]